MKTAFLLLAWLHYPLVRTQECPPMPEITLPNGDFIRLRENSVQFYCTKNYVLFGTKKISCINDTWTPDFDALCIKKENICPSPPDIAHGSRVGMDRYIGAKTFYHCHDDYFMVGSYKLTCDKYRKWDKEPPVCIKRMTNVNDVASKVRNQFTIRLSEDAAENDTSDMSGYFIGKEVLKEGLELFLLLDRSSSLEVQDLEISKSFFKTLLDAFGVDNTLKTSSTRLSVISFAQKVQVVCELNNKTINSSEAAIAAINSIQPEGGGTAIEPALSRVFEYVGMFRKEAKRALFLLTDGEPTVGDLPPEIVASDLRKHFDMEIFAVGIGRDINRTRLTLIASEPIANHVFLLEKFQDLNTILNLVQNPPPTTTASPPPGPDACGQSSEAVNKPWLTAIITHQNVTEERTSFCAGVQICKQWVLTSAACVTTKKGTLNGTQVGIIFGAEDLTKQGHNTYALEIHISPRHKLVHPDNYRLALIKTDHPVPNTVSQPICLQETEGIKLSLRHDLHSKVILEGWGTRSWNASQATILLNPAGNRFASLQSQFSLLEVPTCEKTLKTVLKLETKDLPFWQERLFCTGQNNADKPEKNYCVGNLGSPLVGEGYMGRNQLLGIQTDFNGCKDLTTMYIDPIPYLMWIDKITDNCQEKHKN